MKNLYQVPDNGGAAFFGFMGVSLALVLASKTQNIQISAQPMAQPKQALVSAASPSGDQLPS